MRAAAVVVVTLVAASSVARAAGFQLNEESAPATGMAGAFTAKADDASAIYYNPAGLALQLGPKIYAGGMLVIGQPRASGTPTFAFPEEKGHTKAVFIPNLYAALTFGDHVALGAGLFTNYGLKDSWPETWSGRFLSTFASLETVTLNPTVAWRPLRWLSIGGGIDLSWARAKLRRFEDLGATEARLRFSGNDFSVSGNLGVLLSYRRATDREPLVSLGAHWRARYNYHFDDGALRVDGPVELSGALRDTAARASLPIPDTVSVGVGVRPLESLFLQAQFDFTDWSRFQSLRLETPDNPALSLTIPERWNDGYTLRFGAEWRADRGAARVGFGYDWTPVPESTLSPQIPDSSRWLVSAGGSVTLPRQTSLDLGVMGVIFRSRQSTLPDLPVTYDTFAVLVSLGLSFTP